MHDATRGNRRPCALVASLALATLALTGCEGIVRDLLGIYDGPRPSTTSLSSERVIVRNVFRHPLPESGEPILGLYLDRIRFLDAGDFGSVDRLVVGRPREIREQVNALAVRVGDTLRVSTRYEGVTISGPDPATVPKWSGYRYEDYPLAAHVLTSVERDRR